MKNQVYKYKISIYVIAVCVFLSLQPYFVWFIDDYLNALLVVIMIVPALSFLIRTNEKGTLAIIFFFLCCYAYIFWAGTTYKGFSLIFILPLLFLLIRNEIKVLVFTYFINVLSFVLLLGIITYFLGFFIPLPVINVPPLNEVKEGLYQIHVFHTAFGYRFSSVFDEPGVVGTICALLISYKTIEIKTTTSRIIIIAGLLSLSLAFYIVLLINVLFNFNKNYIIPIVFFAIIYMTLPSNNILSTAIMARLEIVDGKISGDNRTGKYFDNNYERFVEKGGADLLFGRGPKADQLDDADNAGNSSYKMLIYRHGIIGVVIFILFFTFATWKIAPSKRGFFFLFIFLLLAYQRINIFMLYSIVLFIGGLAYINQNEKMKHLKIK